MKDKHQVKILYTNHRGETSIRTIMPKAIQFLSNEWHLEEQWCLIAHDLEKNAERTFACKNIQAWWTDADKKPMPKKENQV